MIKRIEPMFNKTHTTMPWELELITPEHRTVYHFFKTKKQATKVGEDWITKMIKRKRLVHIV